MKHTGLILVVSKELNHLILNVIDIGEEIAKTSNIQKSIVKDIDDV